MPKRRAAGDAAARGGSRALWGKVVLLSLALCLTASGLTWAGWGRTGVSPKAEPYGARPPAAPATAPPSPQSFSPQSPSKEYVYAGGRLVATEEPTPAPLLAQTITFAQPPDRTYGDAPFALAATASSNLLVSFSVTSGPATVSGNTVTITGAGAVSVRADQSGGSGYQAAPGVTRTFAVAKATPALTWANPAAVTYGTQLSATQLNATANVAGSFAYTPPAGTVLSPSNGQQLSVSFAPADSSNYNTAQATARVNVIACPKAQSSGFTASPNVIGEGGSAMLFWTVPNAASVTIGGLAGGFAAAGQASVSPAATTTYTLTGAGAGPCPALTMQTTVTIAACPKQETTVFTADPGSLVAGDSVQLNWSVPYATFVEVSIACQPGSPQLCHNGRMSLWGSQNPSGSLTHAPGNTTTYFLTAGGASGCPLVEKSVTVQVVPYPEDCSPGAYFGVGNPPPDVISLEGTAMLTWSVPNATVVTITDNTGAAYGTFGASGQIWISTRHTRTYTLTAQIAGSAACLPFVLMTTVECSWDCAGEVGNTDD